MAYSHRELIAHTSSAGNPITVSAQTLNHVPNSTKKDTLLIVSLKVRGATDRAGGAPTFGGIPLTQANSTQKAAASPECSAELWYLENPPIGTYDVVIPNTGALTIFYAVHAGQAKQGAASKFDSAIGGNGTSINPSAGSLTTTDDGAYIFSIVATGAQTWAPSGQSGNVINNTDDGADGTGRQIVLQSSKGTQANSWTFGTSDDWGAVAAAFIEVAPNQMNNYHGLDADSGMCVSEKIR